MLTVMPRRNQRHAWGRMKVEASCNNATKPGGWASSDILLLLTFKNHLTESMERNVSVLVTNKGKQSRIKTSKSMLEVKKNKNKKKKQNWEQYLWGKGRKKWVRKGWKVQSLSYFKCFEKNSFPVWLIRQEWKILKYFRYSEIWEILT